MASTNFKCTKCNNRTYESGEMRVTGGFWSKIFDIQNRKFITISCSNCGFTEIYNKTNSTTAENIFDFLSN